VVAASDEIVEEWDAASDEFSGAAHGEDVQFEIVY